MESLLTDTVRLLKANGEEFKGIKASVQPPMIFIGDSSLLIEAGDRIERIASNGLTDMYMVEEPGFQEDFHGIKAHYQIKVRKEGARPAHRGGVTVNISGTSSRVNIDSIDNSANHVAVSSERLFADLREHLLRHLEKAAAEPIIAQVDAMEAATGTPTFKERYQAFVSSAANHMSIIGSFIPALTSMF